MSIYAAHASVGSFDYGFKLLLALLKPEGSLCTYFLLVSLPVSGLPFFVLDDLPNCARSSVRPRSAEVRCVDPFDEGGAFLPFSPLRLLLCYALSLSLCPFL